MFSKLPLLNPSFSPFYFSVLLFLPVLFPSLTFLIFSFLVTHPVLTLIPLLPFFRHFPSLLLNSSNHPLIRYTHQALHSSQLAALIKGFPTLGCASRAMSDLLKSVEED